MEYKGCNDPETMSDHGTTFRFGVGDSWHDAQERRISENTLEMA